MWAMVNPFYKQSRHLSNNLYVPTMNYIYDYSSIGCYVENVKYSDSFTLFTFGTIENQTLV